MSCDSRGMRNEPCGALLGQISIGKKRTLMVAKALLSPIGANS